MKTKFLTPLLLLCVIAGCQQESTEVTQISFEKDSLSLQNEASYTLSVLQTPSDLPCPDMAWESSNFDVVFVDQTGVVTARAIGEETVTAKTLSGLRATCVVTVTPIEPTTIQLIEVELSLGIGDIYELGYQLLPENSTNQDVVWSSSNESIATVQDGEITALTAGQVQIKITASNGLYSTCNVVVSAVEVQGVTLFVSELDIEEEESAQLVATILPENSTNQEVKWSSSDNNTVTVDNDGKITGVAKGEAVVTVTTIDGGHTATCTVNVKNITVKSIALNWESIKLAIGEEYTMESTILPYNAYNQKVLWSSSLPGVVAVDSEGRLTAISRGDATISVTSEDGGFCASCSVEVRAIDEYVVLDANVESTATGGSSSNTTVVNFDLNDRLYNPTSLPITIDSYAFIQQLPYQATFYPGGDRIEQGEYKYNLFSDNVLYFMSSTLYWSEFVEAVASGYSIRYYFTCNGESYVVEESYNAQVVINLNEAPVLTDWWK